MPTSRRAALARGIYGQRIIPVAEIEDFAITRACKLLISAAAGSSSVHGIAISGTRNRTKIKQALGSWHLIERMAKGHGVHRSPGPQCGILAFLLFHFMAGIEQRR